MYWLESDTFGCVMTQKLQLSTNNVPKHSLKHKNPLELPLGKKSRGTSETLPLE